MNAYNAFCFIKWEVEGVGGGGGHHSVNSETGSCHQDNACEESWLHHSSFAGLKKLAFSWCSARTSSVASKQWFERDWSTESLLLVEYCWSVVTAWIVTMALRTQVQYRSRQEYIRRVYNPPDCDVYDEITISHTIWFDSHWHLIPYTAVIISTLATFEAVSCWLLIICCCTYYWFRSSVLYSTAINCWNLTDCDKDSGLKRRTSLETFVMWGQLDYWTHSRLIDGNPGITCLNGEVFEL